ncbi:exonuclease subunit SbcD [Streptomyces sp. SID8375]|uniref:exonuclease SbcCD subunit D n=1 Tax=Streptomyces TaxID=1883 RepID=UPI00036C9C99|nr:MULTISPECIES: exonuclease SbcCD subunit D [unclassified Streptomyces]MYT11535.1 exonuclease subunit SbcD [Streptomyces sp. SID4951]MYX08605.1 exonuclease subunit SbcD [Streptomyces sp. SID8375]SCK10068.1 Exodeoxyribonuclease I subunit D [Streptomyces sp. SceaMP-e96]
MRFLHTSDWHLGRSFHRVNLLSAQRAFLDHLVDTVRAREIDAVLVAGDVYDRAVPPLAAVELFDDALHRLAGLGVPTVMISGNHDSARRLGVGSGLMERAGIHLRTDPADCGTPVLLADAHGPVALYGLPYLEPAMVRDTLGARRADHAEVLGAAMDRVRADLAGRPEGTRSVVLAHAFVTGGAVSDSERDITVGGVASVPVAVFDGVDYAALGHLHGCQTLTERVRYSGSPLAYSFSEADHRKSSWIIDLDADGAVHAERVDCPVPRPLARIRGRLEQLLEDPEQARHEDSWVEATLTDTARPHEPMARLVKRFPHLVSLVFDPDEGPTRSLASYAQRLRGRSDQEIAEDFVEHVRSGRAADEQERAELRSAIDEVRVDDMAAEVAR